MYSFTKKAIIFNKKDRRNYELIIGIELNVIQDELKYDEQECNLQLIIYKGCKNKTDSKIENIENITFKKLIQYLK